MFLQVPLSKLWKNKNLRGKIRVRAKRASATGLAKAAEGGQSGGEAPTKASEASSAAGLAQAAVGGVGGRPGKYMYNFPTAKMGKTVLLLLVALVVLYLGGVVVNQP